MRLVKLLNVRLFYYFYEHGGNTIIVAARAEGANGPPSILKGSVMHKFTINC
jgi:hypothetical protein